MAVGVDAWAKRRADAAAVVASCVRADSSVPMRIWNGSSWLDSEIFSTAGSCSPSISRASAHSTERVAARLVVRIDRLHQQELGAFELLVLLRRHNRSDHSGYLHGQLVNWLTG